MNKFWAELPGAAVSGLAGFIAGTLVSKLVIGLLGGETGDPGAGEYDVSVTTDHDSED